MDTSETYVKMCQKVWSDIGQLPSNGCPSLFITKDRKKWPGDGLLLSDKTDKDILGQVYRQDQLQEIVINSDIKYPLEDLLFRFNIWDDEHLPGTSYIRRSGFSGSMEQLWLGFVMHEKFGKIWNGEEWNG